MSDQMNAFRETLVGILFFGALIIVGASTLLLGTLSLESKSTFTVEFPSAAGMRKGDLVQVDGVIMGRVKALDVLDRLAVREVRDDRGDLKKVTVSVSAEIELDKDIVLQDDYFVQIVQSSVLGGQAIQIVRGTSPDVAFESVRDARLVGILQQGALEALSTMLRENETNLSLIIESFKNIVTRIDRGEGSLGKFLTEESFFDYLNAAASEVATFVRQLNEGDGLIPALVNDNELRDNVVEIVSDAREIVEGVNEGRGTIGKLFADSSLYDQIFGLTTDVRSILATLEAGEGALGMLLKDRDLAQDIRDTITGVRGAVAELQKGESLLGRLFYDPRMGEQLAMVVDDVATIVHRVSLGQGTVGQLLMRDDIGEKLSLLFDIVTGAVEDAREAAPISTFANVIFSAF